MQFQMMLSETRYSRGLPYDHIVDIAECDDPETLLDVLASYRWGIDDAIPGGKKLVIRTLVYGFGEECTTGPAMDVNFFGGQLCVMASPPVGLVEWCNAQIRASQKEAEEHNLGSE
jgi:hypothetical protein